ACRARNALWLWRCRPRLHTRTIVKAGGSRAWCAPSSFDKLDMRGGEKKAPGCRRSFTNQYRFFLLPDRRQAALISKFLHALTLDFGGVDVALGVNGDVVEVFELARATSNATEAAHHRAVAPAQHMDLAVRII